MAAPCQRPRHGPPPRVLSPGWSARGVLDGSPSLLPSARSGRATPRSGPRRHVPSAGWLRAGPGCLRSTQGSSGQFPSSAGWSL